MKLLEAIVQVLKEAREPLHLYDITERLLNRGLWHTAGKTPADTVGARLYTDIKTNGGASPFIKVAPQTFALREVENADSSGKTPAPGAAPERTTPSAGAGLSFADSAQRVLEASGNKTPMHYREITQTALKNGWLKTNGKTPEATMYAQIITDIKRRQGRGEQPRFVQLGHGQIALSQWNGHGLTAQIEQHNQRVRKALREKLMAMTAAEFEDLISILLAEMGFEDVEVTKVSGDGGIDVRGTLMIAGAIRLKMAVQAKKWSLKHHVQAPVVQQVRGSLGAHEQGLIITTSDFSSGAIKEAIQPNKAPIALINGKQLVLLLMEYNIGVQYSIQKLFDMNEDWLPMKSTEK
ncbi:MAG TPA: restriction endonuclease [Candidatus Avidesulfovibrio excrementigallinarum]|nr:restriction endonuclease [Candidatus Avidesulfovibrio excrementigallinarum]